MDKIAVFSISSPEFERDQHALDLLLSRAKTGDTAALSEIYEQYYKKIYRFCFYRVGHKQAAEDLAEDVFVRAFARISSITQNGAFEGWLYQIARNLVIDYYRQKKLTVALDEVENTLEYETNIIDIVNLQTEQKILLKIIKELAPDQQMLIKLKFLEGLENGEIAALMHKNEGTIRVIQHRAIVKLQELIKNIKEDE